MKSKKGIKHDKGKREWSLLPLSIVGYIADVFTFGAKEYSECGWQTVPNAKKRYYDALMRHIEKYQNGERQDKKSKLPTLAHAACCIIILMWHDLKEGKK